MARLSGEYSDLERSVVFETGADETIPQDDRVRIYIGVDLPIGKQHVPAKPRELGI